MRIRELRDREFPQIPATAASDRLRGRVEPRVRAKRSRKIDGPRSPARACSSSGTAPEATASARFGRMAMRSRRRSSWFRSWGATWSCASASCRTPRSSSKVRLGEPPAMKPRSACRTLLGFARAGNRGADDDSRGALGLLWVEQGQSFVLGSPGGAARRTLEAVLAGEVGAVTGGRRTTTVHAGRGEEPCRLLTAATGRPTRRLLAAQQAAALAAARGRPRRTSRVGAIRGGARSARGETQRRSPPAARTRRSGAGQQKSTALGPTSIAPEPASQALAAAESRICAKPRARERLEARATNAAICARVAAAEQDLQRRHGAAAHADGQSWKPRARRERRCKCRVPAGRQRAERCERPKRRTAGVQAAKPQGERRRALAAAFSASMPPSDRRPADVARRALASATDDRSGAGRLQNARAGRRREAHPPPPPAQRPSGASWSPPRRPLCSMARRSKAAPRVAVTETRRCSTFAGIGTVIVEPPAGGEAAQAALRAAEQDLAGFLAQVGRRRPNEARAAARVRSRMEQSEQTLAARLAAACPADPALKVAARVEGLARRACRRDPARRERDAGRRPDARRGCGGSLGGGPHGGAHGEGRREAAVDALRAAELADVRSPAKSRARPPIISGWSSSCRRACRAG